MLRPTDRAAAPSKQSIRPRRLSKHAEPLTALDVTHRLDNLSASDPHQIYAAHGIALARAKEIAPSDDRAVAGNEHFLGLEVRSRFSREPLPYGEAGEASDVARAVRGRPRIFDDAILGDQFGERVRLMALKRQVESAHHLQRMIRRLSIRFFVHVVHKIAPRLLRQAAARGPPPTAVARAKNFTPWAAEKSER